VQPVVWLIIPGVAGAGESSGGTTSRGGAGSGSSSCFGGAGSCVGGAVGRRCGDPRWRGDGGDGPGACGGVC